MPLFLFQLMGAAYSMELTLAMLTPFRCLLWDRLRQVCATTITVLLPCCPYVLVPGTTTCCCCLNRDRRYRRKLANDFLGRSGTASRASSTSPAYAPPRRRRCSSIDNLVGQNAEQKRTGDGHVPDPTREPSTSAFPRRRASSPTLSNKPSCSHGDDTHVEVSIRFLVFALVLDSCLHAGRVVVTIGVDDNAVGGWMAR